jgi:putative endonuclease
MNNKLKNKYIGDLGEDLACKYLENKGFWIVDRNYSKKWGEIDIVAKHKQIIHFIEVKSLNCNLENHDFSTKRPEENLHEWKIKRLFRVFQTYLISKKIESEWQFDVILVFLDCEHKKAKIKSLKNIII